MLEASTRAGSAALLDDRRLLAEVDVAMRDVQREALLPGVERALEIAGLALADVDVLVCGEGPGSFTSLRVAAGLAKGIASALGRPLFAVSSLALIAAAAPTTGRYVAASDALRGEQFAALFEVHAGDVEGAGPHRLLRTDQVRRWAEEVEATLIGPEVDGSLPRASAISRVGLSGVIVRSVDLASWEPAYGRLPAPQARLAADQRASC